MLPIQYRRMRRSPESDAARKQLKEKYEAKINGHIDKFKTMKDKTIVKYEKTIQYAQEQVEKLKSNLSPAMPRATAFLTGFQKNFEKPVTPRSKRSTVMDTPPVKPVMPMLKVVENSNAIPNPCCPVIQELRENSEFRSRVSHPDVLQFMPEVDVNAKDDRNQKQCQQCGCHLSGSSCKICANVPETIQPQYFTMVDGAPVPFTPRTVQTTSKRSANTDYYVYDRFGHKYEENNGNLRLIAPDFTVDPQTTQPNIEAFAQIMNANSEVIHDINQFHGDRMIAPVTYLAADALDFVHDLARREVKYVTKNEADQAPDSEQTKKVNNIKSLYQIIPIRHENKNGSLITKIPSNNASTDYQPANGNNESSRKWSTAAAAKNVSLQKINRNNKEYEILMVDGPQQSADSVEEFDKILKYLHADRSKKNE